MASASLRDELNCSICLSPYTDPVYLRCGHNFCRSCIVSAMDAQEAAGVYSCPDCRAKYRERPALEKNRKLRNIVEGYSYIDMETRVLCAYCTKYRVVAMKSCLQCELSLCREHLEAHNKAVNHILVELTASFESRKCSKHNEYLKYYCPIDTTCICVSCWVAGDHKGHDVDLLDVASQKEKEKWRLVKEKLSSKIEEPGRRIQNLKDHERKQKETSARLTERVTDLFTDIREKLDDMEKGVQDEISRQEKQMSLSVSKLVRKVEIQKYELTKKINQIEGLCNIADPLTLLRENVSRGDITDMSYNVIGDSLVPQCVDEDIVSQMLHWGLLHFADAMIDMKIKRQFPVMEKSDILLDVDSADKNVIISQDLRSASYTSTSQNRPDGPERFKACQVFSSRSFSSGRHYWEVDVSQAERWVIGVAGESLERKGEGNESYVGYNKKSWGLFFTDIFVAFHNMAPKLTESDSPVQAVGIYLDYEAGRLSFYELCDPIRHLYTFTATFTEPLYATLGLLPNSTIRIIK